MIKSYLEGVLKDQPSLLCALGLEAIKNPVVSVVGAGGKTTTIKRAAEEYRRKGIPVIVTTTTHMMAENQPWFLLTSSLDEVREILKREGMVWVGRQNESGKMRAPSSELMHQLLNLGCPVLIEADGARHLPLKIPADHEPVILSETTHVVNVYGLDALGKTFEEICFRSDIATRLLRKKETDLVTEKDIVRLAFNNLAGQKGITSSMSYQVVLNKADTPKREEAALTICRLSEEIGKMKLTVTAREGQAKK